MEVCEKKVNTNKEQGKENIITLNIIHKNRSINGNLHIENVLSQPKGLKPLKRTVEDVNTLHGQDYINPYPSPLELLYYIS